MSSSQTWIDASSARQYSQYWSNIAAAGTDPNAQGYADYYLQVAEAGGTWYDAGPAEPTEQKAYDVHQGEEPKKKKGEFDLDKIKEGKKTKNKVVRAAGGAVWEDSILADWDPNDYRVFVGDLGPETGDKELAGAFIKYKGFQKARVVKDKKTGNSKGFGFVSFKDPDGYLKAMREMQGQYIGNRPVKLRKSNW
jgi:hypothetical protein